MTPQRLAGCCIKAMHPGTPRADRPLVARSIGDADKNLPRIAGHAPVNAAVESAHPGALLPQDAPACIGIKCEDHARFLARQNDVATVCKSSENRRRAKIEIRAIFGGAIEPIADVSARRIPRVMTDGLPHPAHLTGRQFNRDDRIAIFIGGR